ncbi:MAG: LamG-like jellyroll fold domain-containing protein, partial [Planctomycetota bacterium]
MFKKMVLLVLASLVFVPCLVISNTAIAADPDLLLWWKFDDGAGTTATDSSGNGRDGTLVGPPTWVSSLPGFGGALDFGGDNDHVIDADAGTYMNGLSALSVALWIKSDLVGTDRGFIIFEAPTSGQDGRNIRYDSDMGGGRLNGIKYGTYTLTGNREEDESTINVQTTDWQHVCVTWASGSGTFPAGLNLYINGVLDTPSTDDSDAGTTLTGYDRVMVGQGCKDDGTAGWDGIIDDVQIYSKRLTQEEIDAIILGRGEGEAYNPNPADGAVDVPVDANLSWTRDEGAVQDEVYFGTDPCTMSLVDTIMNLPVFPPLYDPPADLIASTMYYWQIVEVNGINRFPGPVWEFTTVSGEAQPEFPHDGAVIVGDNAGANIWTKLIFVPGPTAVSHEGYFSEDYSKVESRDPAAYLGPPPYPGSPGWEYTLFAGNPAVPPATDTLVRGTRYYWTVDANDALNNEFYGDVWEFAIQGFKAFAPSPPNEATLVSRDVLLSWLPGFVVEDHDIYMGTIWEDVNNAVYHPTAAPPEFVATRKDPNYQSSDLAGETKLYWRVDQVVGRMPPPIGGGTYYKGDVWCFTTMPEFIETDPNLVGWWKFDLGVEGIAYDWSGHGNDGTIIGNPPYVTGMMGMALNLEGSPDYVDLPTGLVNSDNGTISVWIKTTLSSRAHIFYGSSENGDGWGGQTELHVSVENGGGIDFWITNDSGGTNVEIGSPPVNDDDWHHVAATWEKPGEARLYVDGAVLTQAHTGDTFGFTNSLRLGRPAQNERYFVGLIDDAQLYDYALSAAEIIRIGAPPEAWMPSPADGETGVASPVTLNWMPGKYAARHDVYFSTDRALVDSRNASAYQGQQDPNNYGPIALVTGQIYYWAIDEVNVAGPEPYAWAGDTWVFRAAGAAGGLLGLYYHWDQYQPDLPLGPPNPFQIFVLSRIDPSVNFDWGNGSPDPNINDNYFATKWIGHLECPVDANYTFYTAVDDGDRLFIDGQKLDLIDYTAQQVDSWRQGGMGVGDWRASIVLSAGLHDIEMHMYEREGGAGARLSWSSDPVNPADYAIPMQVIPPVWLWPPLYASGPRPPDGSTTDNRGPALEWVAGMEALYHELYFSENFDDVNDRNPGIKETIIGDPCRPYPAAPLLKLATTYYWLVDEVKSGSERWDARTVWEFTTAECLSLENVEDYNDRGELRLVWRDGYADVVWGGVDPYYFLAHGGSSGSNLNLSTAVGSPFDGATGPVPPTPLNDEAMVLHYDNDGYTYVYPTAENNEEKWLYDAPYYSEI